MVSNPTVSIRGEEKLDVVETCNRNDGLTSSLALHDRSIEDVTMAQSDGDIMLGGAGVAEETYASAEPVLVSVQSAYQVAFPPSAIPE